MRKTISVVGGRLVPWLLLFVLFVLLPALPSSAGGWATFTLERLPESPRAGEAFDLVFVARAHGRTPISLGAGAAQFVFRHAESGERVTAAITASTRFVGRHTASVVLPEAGDWEWELQPDWYPVVKLEPFTVLPGEQEALIARGKALFAAKGCVTCHRNDKIDEQWTVEIGPNLTNYTNTMASLDAWLANPAAVKPGATMPALGLRTDEIEALVAFLLADTRVAAQ
jgi:cytochrome c2